MEQARAKIGISSCLLGNAVRYDGSDKYCPHIVASLADKFELIAFCPEVAIGLGVPRPAIQLVAVNGEIRARGVANPQQDVSQALRDYAQSIRAELDGLSGYIFKSRSPSCGVADVPVYQTDGSATAAIATGLFAQAIRELWPALPLTNDETLLDEEARGDFILRVQNYRMTRQV